MFYNKYAQKCTTCLLTSPGCMTCNDEGQCTSCQNTQYLKKAYDTEAQNECVNCTTYDSKCLLCNASQCIKCMEGYARILNTCIWKFW